MKEEKLEAIIEYFGENNQKVKAVEELSELIKELTKDINGDGNANNILEELVDCWIMINQLQMIYGFTLYSINELAKYKVNRTMERIEHEKFNSRTADSR